MQSDDAEWSRRLRDGRLFSECSMWWKAFEEGRRAENIAGLASLVVRSTDADNIVPALVSLGPQLAKDERRVGRLTKAALRETWD
jgi:hypothetical protein